MLWFQTSKTSQGAVSDSTSQPSSRTAKSGKFALLSRAVKHSDIHLKVLSLQNHKSFEHFFCFHRTSGIFLKDLERFKADIAFIYTALACWPAISSNFNFDLTFCNAKFHWFVRYQMRVFIGWWERWLARACIEKIFLDQEVNKQNFSSFVELILHSRGWENSRQLCKPSTSSRVCITVSNSPNPSPPCLYQAMQRRKTFSIA